MSNAQVMTVADGYRQLVLSSAALAANQLSPILNELEGESFQTFTRIVRPVMTELGNQFAPVTASMATATYDEMRSLFPPTDGGDYKAMNLLQANNISEMIKNNIAYSFNSFESAQSYDAIKKNTLRAMHDIVKKPSFSNMVENIKRDKAQVIITYMPSSKACRYCKTLVGMGRKSYRGKTLDYGGADWMDRIYRNGSQFHNNCACTPMPQFVTSMDASDFITPEQNFFEQDMKNVLSQTDKMGISSVVTDPSELMRFVSSYQESYRMHNVTGFRLVNGMETKLSGQERRRITDDRWKRIVGPKFGATDEELTKMKQLLAKNNWRPYWLPEENKK